MSEHSHSHGDERDRDAQVPVRIPSGGRLPWPYWLTGCTPRERVSLIMAAVRRCYAECPSGERTGPHLTATMAERYLIQMLCDPVWPGPGSVP